MFFRLLLLQVFSSLMLLVCHNHGTASSIVIAGAKDPPACAVNIEIWLFEDGNGAMKGRHETHRFWLLCIFIADLIKGIITLAS